MFKWINKKYDRSIGQLLSGWILDGKIDEAKSYLQEQDERRLNVVYNASKQLSDLCWQEIKRRKATGTP